MEPMQSLKKMLKWFCVFPFEEATTRQQKVICILLTFSSFVANVCALASAIAFIYKFASTDKEGSLFALIQVLVIFNVIFIMIVTLFVRDKIIGAFQKLSEIYNEYSNDESLRFLARANNASEWLCRIYKKLVIFILNSVGTLAIISVFYCWIIDGNLEGGRFFYIHRIVVPWNQATIIGYLGETMFALTYALADLAVLGICSILFVSMALHHHAFLKWFENKLQKPEIPNTNRNDKEFLCDLINFQIKTKKWFIDTTEIYSPLLMVQLINNTMAIACVAFHFDAQLQHINFTFWYVIVTLSYLIFYNFLYCYFGKISTESHVKMANCLYEYEWQDLPIELQKYFILMIQNAQRPVYYHGFGMINLHLETFCKLINTTFSYYMIFKTLIN